MDAFEEQRRKVPTTKKKICEPEGGWTCVIAPLEVLTRAAQEKKTNVEEVGDGALMRINGKEMPP